MSVESADDVPQQESSRIIGTHAEIREYEEASTGVHIREQIPHSPIKCYVDVLERIADFAREVWIEPRMMRIMDVPELVSRTVKIRERTNGKIPWPLIENVLDDRDFDPNALYKPIA